MTEAKEQELLPCPFCGSTHIVVADAHQPKDAAMCFRCDDCSASIDIKKPATMKQTIAAWNCRAETPAPLWSQEPPTEEGYYFFNDERTLMRIKRSENGDLCVRNTRYIEIDPPTVDAFIKQWGYEQWQRTKKIVHCYWYKVGSPPPLPTEGRAE